MTVLAGVKVRGVKKEAGDLPKDLQASADWQPPIGDWLARNSVPQYFNWGIVGIGYKSL